MSDRSRKIAKPAAALGVLATMASIWWFALRPRRKIEVVEVVEVVEGVETDEPVEPVEADEADKPVEADKPDQ